MACNLQTCKNGWLLCGIEFLEARWAVTMDTKLASACAGWNAATAEAARDDPADRAAGLGRWWLARPGGCIVLSGVAAGLLGVGLEPAHGICWDQVVAEDRAGVQTALARIGEGHAGDAGFNGTGCEFRVRHEGLGVRWLRLDAVGASDDGRIVAGIVVDVTPARHAEARERFNFALTQYLVGSDNLDEAVVNILQLVCEELGWEWGAYWESTSESTADDGAAVLRCRNSWHVPGLALASFEQASLALRLAPEQGLIGEVWASGQARWIDDASSTVDLVRAHAARDCMLHSAFFFPVTFVGSDGRLLRPGVLEFFSNLQRQPDAQLPGLANAISAMIAQAVERMTQQERMRVHAQTDEMTGLANRRHFCDALERMCRNAAPGQSFGVLFVDLDHFKSINDAPASPPCCARRRRPAGRSGASAATNSRCCPGIATGWPTCKLRAPHCWTRRGAISPIANTASRSRPASA
jgi:hypothetical protein